MRTPSASRTNARTPWSAVRRLSGIAPMVWSRRGRGARRRVHTCTRFVLRRFLHSAESAASIRWRDAMGLLDGKKALIFGVANDHSIAWGIARALHGEGAIVGFSSVESLLERRVRPLAESIGSTFVEACDVSSDDQVRTVMAKWKAAQGEIDVLVHAVAYAPREDLE